MVTFVQFSDTTRVISTDTIPQSAMAMFLDANLSLSAGSTVNVDLSTDGKNKASLQPEGKLTYTLTPMNADGRLTGRINIDKGFVRYTPPFMSEKTSRSARAAMWHSAATCSIPHSTSMPQTK